MSTDREQEQKRIAENLRRGLELTELGLALRAAALKGQGSEAEARQRVMREIRLAKERAWQTPS